MPKFFGAWARLRPVPIVCVLTSKLAHGHEIGAARTLLELLCDPSRFRERTPQISLMIRSLILPGLSQDLAADVGLYDVLDRHIVVPGEAGGDVRAFDTFEQLGGGQASGLPAPDAPPLPFTSHPRCTR